MERMSGEDLRQRRTRKHLVTALLELLEEKSFRALSVVDVCQRAMVHRTTFYAHFEDKQALLRYALAEAARELEALPPGWEEGGSRAFFMELFRRLLEFVEAHQGLCRAAAGTGGEEYRMLEELTAGELERILERPAFLEERPGLHPQAAAHFYAGAILAFIRWWLENGKTISGACLAEQLDHFIPIPLPGGQVQKG